jgi:hypothetical protein
VRQDDKKQTADRLRALVESYGTNPERWPPDERASAQKLETSSSNAEAWLTEQRRIDALLDGATDVVPSPALMRRVAEIPLRHEKALSGWRPGWLRNLIGLGTAAAVLGLVVGMTTSEPVATDDAVTEWDDLSTLALGVDGSEELLP